MATSRNADVIKFPLKRVCSECEHASVGGSGVYCWLYREEYWNEKVAQECEEFEPIVAKLGEVGQIVNIKGGS